MWAKPEESPSPLDEAEEEVCAVLIDSLPIRFLLGPVVEDQPVDPLKLEVQRVLGPLLRYRSQRLVVLDGGGRRRLEAQGLGDRGEARAGDPHLDGGASLPTPLDEFLGHGDSAPASPDLFARLVLWFWVLGCKLVSDDLLDVHQETLLSTLRLTMALLVTIAPRVTQSCIST